MKKVLQFLFHRVVIVAVFIAIQVLILVGIIWRFNNYFVYFYAFSILLSVLVLLWIINNRSNLRIKLLGLYQSCCSPSLAACSI